MTVDYSSLCTINGEIETKVPMMDRGLAYGHGVFETIRVSGGLPSLFDLHINRLINGSKILGISIDKTSIETYFYNLIELSPSEGIIKIIITAGSGQRGYAYNKLVDTRYIMQWFPIKPIPLCDKRDGVALHKCKYRLPHSPILGGLKHLNRLDQIIARAEWSEDFYDGLMLDQDDNIIECTSNNIFIFKNESWITPKTDKCGVSGVMREYLINILLPSAGLKIKEVNLSIDAFLLADEVFICNSINGIIPVVSVEKLCKFPLGRETKRINSKLCEKFSCYR
jgi:4-amino-4-deoxychorismate lyase